MRRRRGNKWLLALLCGGERARGWLIFTTAYLPFSLSLPRSLALGRKDADLRWAHTGARRDEHFYSRASLKEGPQVVWIWDGKIALSALLQARERNFLTSYYHNLGPTFYPSPAVCDSLSGFPK